MIENAHGPTLDEHVTVLVGRRVAIARIDTRFGEFFGEAKRAPGDQWNGAVGHNLAYGRALQNYGKFLEDAGYTRSDFLCTHKP